MNYTMKVLLTDPETPKEMYSGLFLNLSCSFAYDENQYGNGHYVSIKGNDFCRVVIDLRYDHTFDRNKKEEWLEHWARNYWTGKNGAWEIKSLEITKGGEENDN